MHKSDIRGMDKLENLIEAARCLGLVQARQAFGQYGPDDAVNERLLHRSIEEMASEVRAENAAFKAQLEVAAAASSAAVSKARWQAVTNQELNQLDATNADLRKENDALRPHAELYRWLRAQHWNDGLLCVVENPRQNVKLGSNCPSGDLLDAAIYAAIARLT